MSGSCVPDIGSLDLRYKSRMVKMSRLVTPMLMRDFESGNVQKVASVRQLTTVDEKGRLERAQTAEDCLDVYS